MFTKYLLRKALNYVGKVAAKGSSDVLWFILMWLLDFLKDNMPRFKELAKATKNKTDDKIVETLDELLQLFRD